MVLKEDSRPIFSFWLTKPQLLHLKIMLIKVKKMKQLSLAWGKYNKEKMLKDSVMLGQ